MASPKIALLGTGNVAFHLAKRLAEKGHSPNFLLVRTLDKGRALVDQLAIDTLVSVSTDLSAHSFDFVILAVPDQAITQVLNKYRFAINSILLHTSGATPMDTLAPFSKNHGVLYPFQTFSKAKPVDFDALPILIEGSSPEVLEEIRQLASILGKNIRSVSSPQRLQIHLAAVFACNFTNHLYGIADQLLKRNGMELADIRHLIQETADKALELGPQKAQTGPAIRGDQEVMQKHLENLTNEPGLAALYRMLSERIELGNMRD